MLTLDLDYWTNDDPALKQAVDTALATERRATVERIREAVNAGEIARYDDDPDDGGDVSYVRILAILDEEAAR